MTTSRLCAATLQLLPPSICPLSLQTDQSIKIGVFQLFHLFPGEKEVETLLSSWALHIKSSEKECNTGGRDGPSGHKLVVMYVSLSWIKNQSIKKLIYQTHCRQLPPDPPVHPKAAGSLQQLVCGHLTNCNFVWEYAAQCQQILHWLLLVDRTI